MPETQAPLQHSLLVVQEVDRGRQQALRWQLAGEAQSPLTTQPPPAPERAHLPLWQALPKQQSLLPRQASPPPLQQMDWLQPRELLQQLEAAVQDFCASEGHRLVPLEAPEVVPATAPELVPAAAAEVPETLAPAVVPRVPAVVPVPAEVAAPTVAVLPASPSVLPPTALAVVPAPEVTVPEQAEAKSAARTRSLDERMAVV